MTWNPALPARVCAAKGIAMIDPLTKGKIRAGRDDGRPTEDDIARAREGEQGIPGKAKPQLLDDDKLQNPKPIDPGHVA
jgi:hypothetical protein